MDSSTRSTNSVSEQNCCEQYVNSLSCEKYIEPKHCTSSCMIETAKSMLLEVAVPSIREKDELQPQEAGICTCIMGVTDPQGQSSSFIASCDEDGMVDSKKIEACQEFSVSVSVDAKVQKGLRKCATFPCSTEVQQKERPPNTADEVHNFYSGSSSYTRSLSLPSSLKLVSAMRGGRAHNGISPNDKLYVKWAPEVYDPPITLMSHTVKSHQQRTKAKKKDNRKHKNIKGKSSRGSSSEKKNVNRRNIGVIRDPLDMSLEATKNEILLNKYIEAGLEAFAVGVAEDKWGTSFLKEEGLAKTNLSTAEA